MFFSIMHWKPCIQYDYKSGQIIYYIKFKVDIKFSKKYTHSDITYTYASI